MTDPLPSRQWLVATRTLTGRTHPLAIKMAVSLALEGLSTCSHCVLDLRPSAICSPSCTGRPSIHPSTKSPPQELRPYSVHSPSSLCPFNETAVPFRRFIVFRVPFLSRSSYPCVTTTAEQVEQGRFKRRPESLPTDSTGRDDGVPTTDTHTHAHWD